MATFRAKYVTKRGTRRVELLDAVDAQQVRDTLRGRGCWVSNVEAHTQSRYKNKSLRVSPKQLLMSLEALNLLVSSGAKIDRALRAAVEQAPAGRLRYVLASIAEGTVNGDFAASFEKFPNVFPEAVIALLKAHQTSGDIAKGLQHACKYYQKWEAIRANAKRGLFMPVLGAITFLAAFTVIFGFTLPKFKQVFTEILPLENMPALTRLFFAISDFFVTHKTFILVSVVGVWWLLKALLQLRATRRILSAIGRTLPIVGPAMKATALARLCITYSNLAQNGLKTVGILEICSRVVGETALSDALVRVRRSIVDNTASSVGGAFVKEGKMFPPEFLTAVSIGESQLPAIFKTLAKYYSKEAKRRIDLAIAAIEPMMTLILALFALSAGAALILPMTQVIGRLS